MTYQSPVISNQLIIYNLFTNQLVANSSLNFTIVVSGVINPTSLTNSSSFVIQTSTS